jgi:hypothetical protein
MFNRAMILMRLMMAAWNRVISGGNGWSCNRPSMR